MGKKLDKKAQAAVAKAAKGVKAAKVDKAVKKFRKLEGKLWTREYLLKIAEFDGATIAPANGAAARADAMGTLAGEHHKLLTSEKSVELVRSLARETVAGGHVDDPQLLDEIRVLGRDQREASVIPTEEAEAWTRLTCEADAVWRKAKTANDWASFEPYVDKIVGQLKHQAELMDPKRDPYDVWLDQYERGLSAKSFDAFCDEVKATVVPLVHAIGERGQQPDADFLHARVPEAAQRAIMSPLLEDVSLESAKAVLYNITAPTDITAEEIAEIGDIIGDATPEEANIIFGVVFDDNIGDEIRLTVIATGIDSPQVIQPVQAPAATVTNFRKPGPDAVVAEPRRMNSRAAQQSMMDEQERAESRLPQSTRRTEVERWYDENSNRPPYLLKREVVGQPRRRAHNPGHEDFTYDEDDFEIPTFIRTQAD